VDAPLAVKFAEPPAQIVELGGVMVINGGAFTVTATVCVPVQPPALVPVTV
jgi:hypothetical protein